MFGCFREPLEREGGAWLVRVLLPLPMLPVLDGLRRGLQPYHSDCFFSDSNRQLSTEILSGNFKEDKNVFARSISLFPMDGADGRQSHRRRRACVCDTRHSTHFVGRVLLL